MPSAKSLLIEYGSIDSSTLSPEEQEQRADEYLSKIFIAILGDAQCKLSWAATPAEIKILTRANEDMHTVFAIWLYNFLEDYDQEDQNFASDLIVGIKNLEREAKSKTKDAIFDVAAEVVTTILQRVPYQEGQ